jgi:steroid delta-isomerase-like uncharacterized protein
MAVLEAERLRARIAIVEEHVRCENRHDLDAVMATFGGQARYDDEPWGDHRTGRDGVRAYYADLLRATPDLEIQVMHRHVAAESLILEVIIRATHLGPWRGLPATGRRLEFPLCGIYTFDEGDRLAGERIYYDRGMCWASPGFPRAPRRAGPHPPRLTHPWTIARAYLRRSPRSSPPA